MDINAIPKVEEEQLVKAISHIIENEVTEQEFSEFLPLQDDLVDANKTYKGKVTMLFVDMRDSTNMTEEHDEEQLVKIYRSYTRVVIQGVRYSEGVVRDFMGDGILAAFVDDDKYKSSDKAIRAARYIATVIDKILNPILDKKMNGFRISCGIGLCTGEVLMTKVGMKGRESNEVVENEYGIAWIGNCTNYACKYSGLVSNGTIFIDNNTYDESTDKAKVWKYTETVKGSRVYKGFIAKSYYLDLDENREAFTAENDKVEKYELYQELQKIYETQLENISKKAEELGKKEERVKKKAEENSHLSQKLMYRELDLQDKEIELKNAVYEFRLAVVASGHCKSEYVCAMKRVFWEEQLSKLFEAGYEIGKTKSEVQMEISYAMVSIYQALELYSEAYDYLVEQVRGYVWVNASTVKKIVEKTGYHGALVSALKIRLKSDTIEAQFLSGFWESKKVLEELGYWS